MKTITCAVDDDTYSELAKFSAADGRPIEELARISLWHSACRLKEPLRSTPPDIRDADQGSPVRGMSVEKERTFKNDIPWWRINLYVATCINIMLLLYHLVEYVSNRNTVSLVVSSILITTIIALVIGLIRREPSVTVAAQ